MYAIHYSNGRVDGGYETLEDAADILRQEYPDAEMGHDGDLGEGGDRTLVWACEADSIDDDGAFAVASIRRENGSRLSDWDPGAPAARRDR